MPTMGYSNIRIACGVIDRLKELVSLEEISERIEPVHSIFTQHISSSRRKRNLDKILDSIKAIDLTKMSGKVLDFTAGSQNHVGYSSTLGMILMDYTHKDDPGIMESSIFYMMGGLPFYRIISEPKIARVAVRQYFEGDLDHLEPFQGDDQFDLEMAKRIPVIFQGRNTCQLAKKLGDTARYRENLNNNKDGLQLIYEFVR